MVIDAQKTEIRKVLLQERRSLSGKELFQRSETIFSNLIQQKMVLNAKNVVCYAAFDNEVLTNKLIEYFLLKEKTVYLPKVDKNNLLIIQIDSLRDLKKGSYGIMEPTGVAVNLEDKTVDLWIVPGIAFDIKGNRLGYGKGYYDRILKSVALDKKIGLCFGFQVVVHIPIQNNDEKMGWLITENKLIKCF